jgi:hypothetical protein
MGGFGNRHFFSVDSVNKEKEPKRKKPTNLDIFVVGAAVDFRSS